MTYTIKYYLYTLFTQLRFTRIINILFIVQSLHFNLIQFAFLQSLFLGGQFISEIPSGIISDLFGKKKIVIIGLITLSLTPIIIITSIHTSNNFRYLILVIAFVLEGVGNALLSGSDDALFYEGIREEGQEKKYAKIRGNMQFISSITLGVATGIGGGLYSYSSILPYICQSFTIIIAIFIIVNVKELKTTAIKKADSSNKKNMVMEIIKVFKEMTATTNIFFIFIFTVITVSVINSIFSFLPNYITKTGFNSSSNGTIFMIYSLLGGLVATQAYHLAKIKIKSLSLLIVFLLVFSLALQIQSNSYIFLIGAGILYNIIDILDPIVMQMLNLWVKDEARATYISGLSFSISLMSMLLNPILGFLIQNIGMVYMLLLITLVTILMIIFAYYMIINSKKDKS